MHNKYQGTVKIDVENKFISVKLRIDYYVKGREVRKLKFYLPSESTNIQVISYFIKNTEVVKATGWSHLIYGDTQVYMDLAQTFPKGSTIPFFIEYSSDLANLPTTGMNMFSDDLVEIGVYTPWFPLTEDFQEATFQVQVDIDDGFILAGNAEKKDGLWYLEQEDPFLCCTILASRKFNNNHYVNNFGSVKANVYWIEEANKEQCGKLNEDINGIMEFYQKQFGPISGNKVDVVLVPRVESESSGGYSRPGLIVLPGKNASDNANSNDLYMYKYLAHELAHLWWNKADVSTWENWLNESFAEYSSLIAIRDLQSKQSFNQYIEDRAKSRELGPIRNCTFKVKDHFAIWYRKGPSILHELEIKIGEESFKSLLRTIHHDRLTNTDDITAKVKELHGDSIGEHFAMLINT